MLLSGGSSGLLAVYDLISLTFKLYREKKTIWTGRRSFIDEFFPRTEASIVDLDQAVALLAGMTVMGFGLYSAADARYKRWWAEEKKRRGRNAISRVHRRLRREVSLREQRARDLSQILGRGDIELQNRGRDASSDHPRS
jgi:hypothetical protein